MIYVQQRNSDLQCYLFDLIFSVHRCYRCLILNIIYFDPNNSGRQVQTDCLILPCTSKEGNNKMFRLLKEASIVHNSSLYSLLVHDVVAAARVFIACSHVTVHVYVFFLLNTHMHMHKHTRTHARTHIFSTEAQKLAQRAGLPTYKCSVVIRRKEDRAKLDAHACPECEAVSCYQTRK